MPDQVPESSKRPVLNRGRPVLSRGRPFLKGQSGNPAGRPQGVRNRTTVAAQSLLDGEAEALSRKAVELALGGDINALRLCLDRVLPLRREEPIQIELRRIECLGDAISATEEVIAAAAAGKITLSQALQMAGLIELYIRADAASDRASEAVDRQFERERNRRS